MRRTVATLVLFSLPLVASAGEWHTDYSKAWKAAKSQDKPILVYFADDEAPVVTDGKFLKYKPRADKFVLVRADRKSNEGKELYDMFEMSGRRGAVVIERNQEWQFARFERDLSENEVGTLLEKTTDAKGVPQSTVVLTNAETTTLESAPSSGSYCPNCVRRGF